MKPLKHAVYAFCVLTGLLTLADGVEAAAPAGKLPLNRWVNVSAGELPSTQGLRGADRIYNKLVWVPALKKAYCWPNLCKAGGRVYTFSASAGKWDEVTADFPTGQNFAGDVKSPLAGCYLPKARKLLFVLPNNTRFSKQHATTWLLDPVAKKWEIQTAALRMCDAADEFNPAGFRKDRTVPFWGGLIYDPVNEEAVAFGGGCTWGRVGKSKEKVGPGDWVYDQTAEPKRVRRLTAKDKDKLTAARKWFPAHTGTWVFSEKTGKWAPTPQPMSEQPSGRILSQMAYDASEKKIVLFGGDDRARCLNDTWVYDCAKRTWKQAKPAQAPPARAAHALVYVPEQKVVLLAGGYGGGWQKLKDTWIYETSRNKWTRLGMDLPSAAQYCSGVFDPEKKMALVVAAPSYRRNRAWPVYGLKLNLRSAPRSGPAAKRDPDLDYHCTRFKTDVPGKWLSGKGAPEDPTAVRARLKALPANSWKLMTPPKKAVRRDWGTYIYDPVTHRAFAWGGGHSTYPGSDISEYDLLTNRWRGQADPAAYYPRWCHGMPVGISGTDFAGNSMLPSHSRKAYGIDPLSKSVITWTGDVYDMREHRVIKFVGTCPPRKEKGHPVGQPVFLTTSHGLYAYLNRRSSLYRANVKMGRWDVISRGGPKARTEWAHLAYDSKRDRLVYFHGSAPGIWIFDFKAGTWAQEKVNGADVAKPTGTSTYVPEIDAVLLVFATARNQPEKLYFYKLGEHRWYTAPSVGDVSLRGRPVRNYHGLNHSPYYDPQLGLVVRVLSAKSPVEVFVMRLDAKTLKLTSLKK
jgi:Galactose oxidase, central domain